MGISYIRICYKHGIEKEEDKLIEIHKSCECIRCNNLWGNRTRTNMVVAYAKTVTEAEKIEAILSKWTCADGNKNLPTFYYNHASEV